MGQTVTVLLEEQMLRVIEPVGGEILAERPLVQPGEPASTTTTAAPGPDELRRAVRPSEQTRRS